MAKVVHFTQAQRDAIDSENSMIITACPGSGKTTLIVEKIRKDFESLKAHQGVIGISFTIKASAELSAKCRRNGADIKSSFFGTIDNFCLTEIIHPFISRIFGKGLPNLQCKKYSDIDQAYKDHLPDFSQTGNSLKTEDFALYSSEFEKHYKAGVILLEAITLIAHEIILKSKACRRYLGARYRAIYVDEYQDTSQPQHALFCAIHDLGIKAVAVGDIQQSIYGFRGSNPQHLISLIEKATEFDHHIINTNHRCHPSIVNYANRLYSSTCTLIPVDAADIRMLRRKFPGTQEDVSRQLGQWILDAADKAKIQDLSEIAILARWNSSIERLQQNLTVPARFYKDDALSILSSPAAKLISNLIQYYLDESILAQNILDEFPMLDAGPSASKSARSLITGLRGLPLDKLESGIENVIKCFKLPELIFEEKQALGSVLGSSEALSNYSKRKPGEIQVMTLHKSKGLEFDMVIHLDLYNWIFPARQFTGNFNDEVFPDWDQDLNLHYVGITRARKWCVLVSSDKRLNAQNQIKSADDSQFYGIPGLAGLFR